MKVFGLTGGIGSGKSTVAQIMREYGIPVFDADQCSRDLTRPGSVLAGFLSVEMGVPLLPDDSMDRKGIAAVVFSDPVKRERLEYITHEAILKRFATWRRQNNNPFCFAGVFDAPLIFETGLDARFPGTIVVLAPEAERIARVMARNPQMTEAQVRERMAVQVSDEVREAKGCYVIDNDSTLEVLRKRTLEAMRAVLGKVM